MAKYFVTHVVVVHVCGDGEEPGAVAGARGKLGLGVRQVARLRGPVPQRGPEKCFYSFAKLPLFRKSSESRR